MNAPLLTVEMHTSQPPAGTVVLVNPGSSALRVWRLGNSWGDETLSFEIASGGHRDAIRRKPQVYTRNIPASVVLERGEKQEIAFAIEDGQWEPAAAVARLAAADALITAIYRVAPSPEASAQGVWIGELRSEPVHLR
jgi:hypothetical protein